MKTKISIFITAITILLLGATIASAQGMQAYFKKGGATVFQSAISDIDSIVFKQVTNEDVCQSYDNPQGVVINGVRWATRNVGEPGTFASSPCDYGEYYQWNKGTTDDFLLYADYYNSVYANSGSWLPANDPSPAGWRVPISDEINKLTDTNYVTYEWIDNNGLIGGKFTDKATGNSIFLPAAGYRDKFDGALYTVGNYGNYWSSTASGALNAYSLRFYYGYAGWWDYGVRGYGFSVRSVSEVEIEVKVTDVTISPSGDVSVEIGKRKTLTATITPSDATNKNVTWSSLNPDIATINEQMGVVLGISEGVATIRATAVDGSGVIADKSVTVIQPISDDINGVLINGVVWAPRNVDAPGAFTTNPEDPGMFYQWNRKIGWSATDPMVNSNGGATWDGSMPAGTTWEKVNDPSPSGWRVPTLDELQKLLDTNYVTNGWATQNGVLGEKFKDKATGNSIFLPAAGCRFVGIGMLYGVGFSGYYWNSTVGGAGYAYALGFGGRNDGGWWNFYGRDYGFSVRSVAE